MNEETTKLIVVFLAGLATLGVYSILYKENKIFRFFEHMYLGLAAGYAIATTWNDVLKPNWWEPMTQENKWWLAILLPAGSLFYFIYSKKHAWMARLIFGVFIGFAAGASFQSVAADYWPKILTVATKKPLNPASIPADPNYPIGVYSTVFNNLLYLVILASVMTYFFFAFDQKSPAVRNVSRFGRYAMMVAFGAMFGMTIMGRMSLLIGRVYFLIHDWVQVAILHQTG